MSKIKVSTLTGALLNYWVAKANEDLPSWFTQEQIAAIANAKQYSTDWSQAGPIIEREKIESHFNPYAKTWIARYFDDNRFTGETLLVAAMRAFVASKFGEEVDG